MIIVQCPECHSKFRFQSPDPDRHTFRLRCSVCRHVFEHTLDSALNLDQEFDLLVSSSLTTENKPGPEAVPSREETDQVLTETPEMETESASVPSEEPPREPTESVMREIDSILGTSDQMEGATLETAPEEQEQQPSSRRGLKIAIVSACVVVIALALSWLFKDWLVVLQKKSEPGQHSEMAGKGPFFVIDEGSVTHELLNHEQEGSVLVIRGTIRQTTTRPAEAVIVEARVMDRQGRLLDKRIAYAGIVPDIAEFARQPRADIDALLTADPSTPGSTLPAGDIPFAVVFFGKATSEGVSYQVEVKEARWK